MPPLVDAVADPSPTRPAAARDDPTASILMLLAAMLCLCCSDATAKYLGGDLGGPLPPLQIAWMRWAGFLVIFAPALIASRGAVLRSAVPVAQLLRATAMLVSAITFIAALGRLPMASATAMAFAAPLLVTALSIPMLGERVGPRRWAAVAVGLVGVLIVVRPGGDSFDSAAIFPLLSALAWAFTIVFTRVTSRTDGPTTTMATAAVLGFVALSFAVPFTWTTPSLAQVGWTALMAATSTLGQFLTVLAYRRAAASLLVPFSYSQIVWSSLAGALVFGQVPDAATGIGAAIIVASGVYTAHRERIRAREARG